MSDVPYEPGAEPRKLPPPAPKVPRTSGEPARPDPVSSIPPGEPDAERLAKIRLDRNPLLEAARPRLGALADMPEKLIILIKKLIIVSLGFLQQAFTLWNPSKSRPSQFHSSLHLQATSSNGRPVIRF